MEAQQLRAKVHDRLRTGELPRDLPPAAAPAIRTETGAGEPCAACEEPIARGQPLEACEYPSGQVLRFHGECYKCWNEERAAR